jgi:hypothetical protein
MRSTGEMYMSEEVKKPNDTEELDRMEFEIFKKYWQPMMQELIELQELRNSVGAEDVGTVKKMSSEIDMLRKGFDELRGMVASLVRPQAPPQQYQMPNTPYNPGLAHMPLYRAGQSYVVSPVQQAN